jgi:hypothetical protein
VEKRFFLCSIAAFQRSSLSDTQKENVSETFLFTFFFMSKSFSSYFSLLFTLDPCTKRRRFRVESGLNWGGGEEELEGILILLWHLI